MSSQENLKSTLSPSNSDEKHQKAYKQQSKSKKQLLSFREINKLKKLQKQAEEVKLLQQNKSHPTSEDFKREVKGAESEPWNESKKDQVLKSKAQDSRWDFEVDYNDHFETPKQAYDDLIGFLDQLCQLLSKSRNELIIYDPYYCQGNMVNILKGLGFDQIINNNRDFYHDIKTKKLPNYDVLVTNPPYSGDHKSLLLNFLKSTIHRNRPFALLLPVYTISKSYWKDYYSNINQDMKVCYLLPNIYYSYNHPEGTGKDIPPFYSIWFLSLSNQHYEKIKDFYPEKGLTKFVHKLAPSSSLTLPFDQLHLIDNPSDLVNYGLVTEKRPNPRQRNKIKQQFQSHSH